MNISSRLFDRDRWVFMISYEPLWKTMKNRNATTYTLQTNGVSSSTIRRLKDGESVSTNTLDLLCEILKCNIPDLIEYKTEEKR